MNIGDKGYVVQYIYSLLQNESELFRQTYHLDNEYTTECHQLLLNYYQELLHNADEISASVYSLLLTMFNRCSTEYYDEQDDFRIFSSKTDSIKYRCFIIPVSYLDTLDSPLVASISPANVKYRFTSRTSIYKILVDSTDKTPGTGVWSSIMNASSDTYASFDLSTILKDPDPTKDADTYGVWKYMIIGIPLPTDLTAFLLSSTSVSEMNHLRTMYDKNPWILHDEFIPYLLGHCITPISAPDDIWYVQRAMADQAGYLSTQVGVWDSQLTSLIDNIEDNLGDNADVFNFGFFTPKVENYMEMNALNLGEEMDYYEFF